jgi:hypothetical protein
LKKRWLIMGKETEGLVGEALNSIKYQVFSIKQLGI